MRKDFVDDALAKKIAMLYFAKEYDLKGLAKIDQIKTLPVNEGCKIAIEYTDVLSSLSARECSRALKNLVYLKDHK